MSWQDDWRLKAWEWARRLDRLASGWLVIERQGMVSSAAVRGKRALAMKVRDWIYEVIETFLGGVDALPDTPQPLGLLPQLVIGGAVVVTVTSIAAWISNEEERLVHAKRLFVKAVGEEVAKTSDPEVKRKLAGVVDKVAPDEGGGFPWGWVLFGAVLAGGVGVARQRMREV